MTMQLETRGEPRNTAEAPAPAGRGSHLSRSRWAHLTAGRCLAVLLLVVVAAHIAVLRHSGEPSGLDFGNWLTIGHHWLGMGTPDGSRSTYPPVVPLLSVLLVSGLGPSWGTALLASLAGLAPAVGVWVVLRDEAPKWAAVTITVVIACAGSTGEAVAWGGVPQLLGLGTGLVALWALVRMLRAPSARRAWLVGSLLLAVGTISHLVLAQVLVCAVVLLTLHLAVVRRGVRLSGPWSGREGLPLLALRVALPVALLAPLYWSLAQSVGRSFVGRSQPGRLGSVLDSSSELFRDAPLVWKAAAVLTLLTPLLLLRLRRQPLWLLVSGILITHLTVTMVTSEARLAYLVPLDIGCALGLWARQLSIWMAGRVWSLRAVAILPLVALAGFACMRGLAEFPAQRGFYGNRLMSPGSTQALEWLRSHTPPDSLVAVTPVYGLPFGWWVEGFGRRATLTGSSELYLNFPDERARAGQAVSLFSLTGASASEVLRDAQVMRVDYLYVSTKWGGLAGSSVQRLIDDRPWRVAYRNAAAIIIWTG